MAKPRAEAALASGRRALRNPRPRYCVCPIASHAPRSCVRRSRADAAAPGIRRAPRARIAGRQAAADACPVPTPDALARSSVLLGGNHMRGVPRAARLPCAGALVVRVRARHMHVRSLRSRRRGARAGAASAAPAPHTYAHGAPSPTPFIHAFIHSFIRAFIHASTVDALLTPAGDTCPWPGTGSGKQCRASHPDVRQAPLCPRRRRRRSQRHDGTSRGTCRGPPCTLHLCARSVVRVRVPFVFVRPGAAEGCRCDCSLAVMTVRGP